MHASNRRLKGEPVVRQMRSIGVAQSRAAEGLHAMLPRHRVVALAVTFACWLPSSALVQGCRLPGSTNFGGGSDGGGAADGGTGDSDAGPGGSLGFISLGPVGTFPHESMYREHFAKGPDGTLHLAFAASNGVNRGIYYGHCTSGCSTPEAWNAAHLFDTNLIGTSGGEVTGFGIDGSGRRHLLVTGLYATCPSDCDQPRAWSHVNLEPLLNTNAENVVRPLLVKPDGTVGIITRGSPYHAPQYAECRAHCTDVSSWVVGEVYFKSLPLNAVVDEAGVTHLLLETQDVYGDLHYAYARCAGNCTSSVNWQETDAAFLHRSPGENAGFAVTSSGRVFLAFNLGHPVVTGAFGGFIDDLVLSSCAGDCLVKGSWSSATLADDSTHEGLAGGVWLTADGERLWLGTTTAHELRLRRCDGDCARAEGWSAPTVVDTDVAITQAMPPDTGTQCPGQSTSSSWAPALPRVAASSKGLVIAHNPRRVVFCPADTTIYRPPPIGRITATF